MDIAASCLKIFCETTEKLLAFKFGNRLNKENAVSLLTTSDRLVDYLNHVRVRL